MKKRCPKCGKAITSGIEICPICGYKFYVNKNNDRFVSERDIIRVRCHKCGRDFTKRYSSQECICPNCRESQVISFNTVMRKCRKCGADFFKQSSSSEQLCPDCRKNKTYENNNPVSKTNHAGKIIACIFSVAVLSIGGFFAYKSLSSNTPTVQQAETAYESYEKVNSTLSDIISDADFQNSSEEEKKQKIENALNLMIEESLISNVNYNSDTLIYEYAYSDGSLGGVMLEPFDENVNGISKNYADTDQNGKVTSINNKVSFDTNKYSYSRTNMKAKVMYGLGFDDVLKMVDKRSDVWTSEGLATDIDKDCTVADFAEGLIGYDFIDIEEHGTLYNNTPIICTEEIVTEQNINEYYSDIINGNILLLTYENDHTGNTYYCIMPSFFTSHYKNNELNNSIVYLGCCQGFINDKLVNAFKDAGASSVIANTETVYTYYNYYIQDAFVYSLMCGDSVDDALDFATDIWGENDIDWAGMYLTDYEIKPEIATPKIASGGKVRLVEITENKSQKTPEFVEEILSWSEEYEPMDGGSGWLDTYEMYKGYMGHNHAENDEMWFQDITGDDEPELIIGGYGLMIGQSERKCFNVYEKDNGGIAFGEDLYTLWSSNRSDYGHDAFSFTPYKDSNGKIILADGQFYAFTGADLPEDAGAYTLNEFVFGNSDKKIQCSVKIYFNYDSENKKYISLKVGNDEATSSEVINAYNNYFTDKTPLKASIKTIKKLDYIKMTQEERKKALTESYYAFKYTEDKTIKPPLKDMIDKIPKDNSDKDDTDNVEKNNNPNVKDIYSAYLDKLSELNQQPSVEPAYSLFDINRDGIDELIYIYDRVAVASRFHVYEYHPDDGSVVSTGDSDTTWNDLYYSKTLDCLVNYYSHGCNVDENTPSGIITFLTKYSLVNGKLESEEIYKGDAQEFSENKYSYYDLYEITIGQCSGCTIDDLKSNSASNKF